MEQRLTSPQTWPAIIAAPARHGMLQRLRNLEGAEALPFILASKVATLALLLVAYFLFPVNDVLRGQNFAYPSTSNTDFATRFTSWDASHYLFLAEEGFAPGQQSNAFPPLFPLAIRVAHIVIPDLVTASVIVANLASGVALYLLYTYAKRRYGRAAALKGLILLLAMPTAFYLNLVYTEGLFLLLAMLFFIGLERRNLPLAAGAAFLMPLARLIGIAVVVPFGIYLIANALQLNVGGSLAARLHASLTPQLLWLLAPIAGAAAYCLYMQIETGDPLEMVHAHALFAADLGGDRMLNPIAFVKDLFTVELALHHDTNSILDRLFFFAYLASLPLAWKRLDRPTFAFAVVMGLAPLAGSFMSYMRYLLMAFPLFLAWGTFFESKSPRLFFYSMLPLLIMQEFFVVFQVTHNGVS